MPYAEIARQLGMTELAVKVSIHRLRKRFRDSPREEVVSLNRRGVNPPIKGAAHAWIGIILGGLTTVLWGGLVSVMVSRLVF